MRKLNVCYTVNSAYLKPMLVSIYSLLENNSDLDISIYIIFEDLSINEQKVIDQVLSKFINCHAKMYDIDYVYPKLKEYEIPKWRGTKIANARLFLSEIIPNCPDTLLYLDSDTIVVSSLKKLGEKKLNYPASAVLDHMSKSYWKNLCPELKRYYNSGVVMFDYNLWDKNNIYEKIRETLSLNYHLTYPDQDILNIALKNKIATLPLSYNVFPIDIFFDIYTLQKFFQRNKIDFYSKERIEKARTNPHILHSAAFYGIRPWEENVIHPYQEVYEYYLRKIDGKNYSLKKSDYFYANMNPDLFKILEYLKFYTPSEVKNVLKKVLKKN